MKIFALFHVKGGVGKTASAVNLAALSARDAGSTLLWDLDPQAAATFYLRIQPEIRGGARKLIRGECDPRELVRESDFENLDVLPAEFSNRRMDAVLLAEQLSSDQVLRVLEPLEPTYQHVFLDCAPSLSALSESIFDSCDVLLCPTVPTTLSLRTLAQLMKHLKKREGRRPLVLPFFCMVDRRKSLHRRITSFVTEERLGFLATAIPYSSLVEQMGLQRNPIFAYAPASPPARAYEELWAEILERSSTPSSSLYEKATRKALERAAGSGAAPFSGSS